MHNRKENGEPGLSISFKSTSTSLFKEGTFALKFEQFTWISLKSGGIKYHFRRVTVTGTTPYWNAWRMLECCNCFFKNFDFYQNFLSQWQ